MKAARIESGRAAESISLTVCTIKGTGEEIAAH